MRKKILRLVLGCVILITSNIAYSATVTAKLIGGNWDNPSTWEGGVVPACGDEIIIPFASVVIVNVNVDLNMACGAASTISVFGALTFERNRSIVLEGGSCVSVPFLGVINPNVSLGNFNFISVNGVVVWSASGLVSLPTIGPTNIGDCGGLLPVEIVDFSLEYIDNQVEITFVSSSERNLDYYVVEVSKDGNYWQELEKVPSNVNSSTEITYKVTDRSPFVGLSYYRLKNIDLNGDTQVIDFIVSENRTENYLVYPIPVNELMFIEGGNLENNIVKVFNSLGENVALESLYMNDKLMFNFSEVKNGLYLVSIENENSKVVRRVSVAHR